jgi:hypothetical protein
VTCTIAAIAAYRREFDSRISRPSSAGRRDALATASRMQTPHQPKHRSVFRDAVMRRRARQARREINRASGSHTRATSGIVSDGESCGPGIRCREALDRGVTAQEAPRYALRIEVKRRSPASESAADQR